MKWIALGVFSFAALACAPSATVARSVGSPVELLPASPEKGALFAYYQPKGISKWKSNWTAGLDLTGVSWNHVTGVTLISPSHVVMAAHFMRGGQTPVMFHDREGKPYERYMVATRVLTGVGDVAVGKLNLPLPASVKAYPLVNAPDAKPGTPVITTDQTLTVSIHEIAAVTGGNVRLAYSKNVPEINRRNLIVGDSGHPTFLLKNGGLYLVETHTTGGPGAGPFYGDPAVQAAIKNAMKEMGD